MGLTMVIVMSSACSDSVTVITSDCIIYLRINHSNLAGMASVLPARAARMLSAVVAAMVVLVWVVALPRCGTSTQLPSLVSGCEGGSGSGVITSRPEHLRYFWLCYELFSPAANICPELKASTRSSWLTMPPLLVLTRTAVCFISRNAALSNLWCSSGE